MERRWDHVVFNLHDMKNLDTWQKEQQLKGLHDTLKTNT